MSISAMIYAYLAMSVITFAIYGIDKFKAKHAMWRTPEKTLHVLELLCGWPGALLAQRLLRHKSYKKSFRIVFWCMVVLNLIIVIGVYRLFK